MLKLRAWFKKYWKYIAIGILGVASAIAYAVRGVFRSYDSPFKDIENAINKNTESDRERTDLKEGKYRDEIEKERVLRANLERNIRRAARRRAESHRAVDDCDGDVGCINDVIRRHSDE